jgi:hypothetical protein
VQNTDSGTHPATHAEGTESRAGHYSASRDGIEIVSAITPPPPPINLQDITLLCHGRERQNVTSRSRRNAKSQTTN